MSVEKERIFDQVNELLNIPNQMWLLGAGVSKESGIPLMHPLTDRIETLLEGEEFQLFQRIRAILSEESNIEDVLSHLGDLLALCNRSRNESFEYNGNEYSQEELQSLYDSIQKMIRDVIRFGYKPDEGGGESIGTISNSIVEIDSHLAFVRSLFKDRRAGFNRRPSIKFYTTNYDTLLEDALALSKLHYTDGFSGGAMGFWSPERYESERSNNLDAELYKLHGSIDWFVNEEDIVVRRREGVNYPDEEQGRLLIYPQSTKYIATQRDPFATLFSKFRDSLISYETSLLSICGFSFNDDHINEEINQVMSVQGNTLTILAFCWQDVEKLNNEDKGLPKQIYNWLSDSSRNWKNRLVVATNHGLYQGDLINKLPFEEGVSYDWWRFDGLTDLLKNGPK